MSPRGYCPALGDGTQTVMLSLDGDKAPVTMAGSLKDATDARAASQGLGRSAYIRSLILADLTQTGIKYERYALVPARTVKDRKAGVKG